MEDIDEPDSSLILELNATCDTPILVPTLMMATSTSSTHQVSNLTNSTRFSTILETFPHNFSSEAPVNNFLFNKFNLIDYRAGTEPENVAASWVYGLVGVAATAMLPVLGFAFHPFQKRRWFANILLFFVAQTTCHVLTMSFLVYLPKAVKFDLANERFNFIRVVAVLFVTFFLCFNMEIFHCQAKSANSTCKKKNKLTVKRSSGWSYCCCRGSRFDDRELSVTSATILGEQSHNNNLNGNQAVSSPTSTIEHYNSMPHHNNHPRRNGTALNGNNSTYADSSFNNNTTTAIMMNDEPSLPKPIISKRIFGEELRLLNSASAFLYIFAECLVTLVDGFRIGAALLNSGLASGIAVSFVIFTEEMPRKIGGVTLLRYIGCLTIGQAIGCSMIASCFLFIGFVSGAFVCGPFYYKLLSPWAYAIALAFFVHVGLVTVIPAILRTIVQTIDPENSGEFPLSSAANPRHNNNNAKSTSFSPNINNTNRQSTQKCQLKINRGRFAINMVRMFVVNLGFIVGCSVSLVLAIYAESLPYMNIV